jgi:hypothetical protein
MRNMKRGTAVLMTIMLAASNFSVALADDVTETNVGGY